MSRKSSPIGSPFFKRVKSEVRFENVPDALAEDATANASGPTSPGRLYRAKKVCWALGPDGEVIVPAPKKVQQNNSADSLASTTNSSSSPTKSPPAIDLFPVHEDVFQLDPSENASNGALTGDNSALTKAVHCLRTPISSPLSSSLWILHSRRGIIAQSLPEELSEEKFSQGAQNYLNNH